MYAVAIRAALINRAVISQLNAKAANFFHNNFAVSDYICNILSMSNLIGIMKQVRRSSILY